MRAGHQFRGFGCLIFSLLLFGTGIHGAEVELYMPSTRGEFANNAVFDSQSRMFLAWSDSSVRRVLTNSVNPIKFISPGLDFRSKGAGYMARGMTVDPQGNLYLTDGTSIFRVEPRGSL